MNQQATESRHCYLLAVYRTNNHNIVEREMFFSPCVSLKLNFCSFTGSFVQLIPSFLEFVRGSKVLLSLSAVTWLTAWQADWSLGGCQTELLTVPFFLPFPKGDNQVMPSLPICYFSQAYGKGASAKWSHHWLRDSKATRRKHRQKQTNCTNCISFEKLAIEICCFNIKANFPVVN